MVNILCICVAWRYVGKNQECIRGFTLYEHGSWCSICRWSYQSVIDICCVDVTTEYWVVRCIRVNHIGLSGTVDQASYVLQRHINIEGSFLDLHSIVMWRHLNDVDLPKSSVKCFLWMGERVKTQIWLCAKIVFSFFVATRKFSSRREDFRRDKIFSSRQKFKKTSRWKKQDSRWWKG